MKYTAENKKTIVLYILEKISESGKLVSSAVAENFGISTNTVHSYLNELQREGIIEKQKRGEYQLVTTRETKLFSRSQGGLESDTRPFDECVEGKIGHLNENIYHIWAYAVSEMVNNVIDHSEAENMWVSVEQNYLKTSVLIADDGVGIFEKIKSHFALSSLDEAICELFKGKLTTDKENHSGEGIFFTSKMMDSFLISSSKKTFTTSKYSDDSILDIDLSPKGTSVYMSLSNFTQREAREVFDAYSDVDGGFTTTVIPLKNIFDTAPVSRSQAKRICNRLEEFEEIILDFEGVSWMGQGFAHQIFVVYQNAHPSVKITPVNMCEGIESMYRHVVKTK